MNNTSLRTQIILPKDLRLQIERQRKLSGESLAEYLRVAAKERLEREKKKKADLRKLADEVIGSIKPTDSGWGGVDVDKWLRKTRREEDEHWLKRWNEALKSPSRAKRQ